MAKEEKSSLVWAVKDGYDKREFTEQQLKAMGTDPGGKTYDGWKIVSAAKEPEEVTKAKRNASKQSKTVTNKNDKDYVPGKGIPGIPGDPGITGQELREFWQEAYPTKDMPEFGEEFDKVFYSKSVQKDYEKWHKNKWLKKHQITINNGDTRQSLAETEATGDTSTEDTGIIGNDSPSSSEGDAKASGSH